MSMLPSLTAGAFALAGLVCAMGPIIIHLLNRRRFRTVHWAAMDFLREALQRNRRAVEMRDIALLALRVLAVFLFGLAIARPFTSPGSHVMWAIVFPCVTLALLCAIVATAMWSEKIVRWSTLAGSAVLFGIAALVLSFQIGTTKENEKEFDGTQPLHAVLVVDNSMSMGYQSLDGVLLDKAKARAKEFVERLPEASPVSIIPLCGSRVAFSTDPYAKAEALEMIDRIEVVDRAATLREAAALASTASKVEPHLAKRIVVMSDQQQVNWQGLNSPDQFGDFPEMQVVDVSSSDRENSWIADFRIEDGLADTETPTTFVVELRHEGRTERRNVQVSLLVDDTEVASKTVSLQPGQGSREVRFEYLFNNVHVEPGHPAYVPIVAKIAPDHLPADDTRHMVAHVVAALPVVFVDQYGDGEEDVRDRRIGETKSLRKLLAPVTSRDDSARQLVKIKHVSVQSLNRDILADARLVAIAGIADPGASLPLLREYVEQGGQLVVAAGAQFDPGVWANADAAQDAGVLPAPLHSALAGELPEVVRDELKYVFLSYDSLQSHYYFRLADTSEEELQDLYSLPLFFRYVEADVSSQAIRQVRDRELERIREAFKLADLSSGATNGERKLSQANLNWLIWGKGSLVDAIELPEDDSISLETYMNELADRSGPRVLARFDDEQSTPFLIQRRIGHGTVLFVASGLQSSWNTLHTTDAVLIFDRILRSMIQSTLPTRNFDTDQRIAMPLETADQEVQLALYRPGEDQSEVIDTGFIGKDIRGYSVDNTLERGVYRVDELDAEESSSSDVKVLSETLMAVNGPSTESELSPLSWEQFRERTGEVNIRWVRPGEEISLQGAQSVGQDFYWMILIVAVLIFLIVELGILAWPDAKQRLALVNGGLEPTEQAT